MLIIALYPSAMAQVTWHYKTPELTNPTGVHTVKGMQIKCESIAGAGMNSGEARDGASGRTSQLHCRYLHCPRERPRTLRWKRWAAGCTWARRAAGRGQRAKRALAAVEDRDTRLARPVTSTRAGARTRSCVPPHAALATAPRNASYFAHKRESLSGAGIASN